MVPLCVRVLVPLCVGCVRGGRGFVCEHMEREEQPKPPFLELGTQPSETSSSSLLANKSCRLGEKQKETSKQAIHKLEKGMIFSRTLLALIFRVHVLLATKPTHDLVWNVRAAFSSCVTPQESPGL